MIARRDRPAEGMTVDTVECQGMRLLSRHDLAGRGNCGEGTALLEHGGRRYLYLAHEQGPVNFSVLDVTDPTAPRLLTQTTLPHGDVRSNSLAVGDGLLVVAYQVRQPGQQPAGIEIFDLAGRPSRAGPAFWTCRVPARAGLTGWGTPAAGTPTWPRARPIPVPPTRWTTSSR